MESRHLCLAVFMLYMWPLASHAELDNILIDLSQPINIPLHWENVKDAPLWISGKSPKSNADWEMHNVHLYPEQTVTVLLMPGKWLRIYNPDEYFTTDDLEISVSNGTGLYAFLPIHIVDKGHSIIVPPEPTLPRLVRIQRGYQHEEARDLALFISRYEQSEKFIPERTEISLPGDSVSLLLMPQRMVENFSHLQAYTPMEVKLSGPARIALENRLIYPSKESALAQNYQIYTQLDESCRPNSSSVLEFETGAETEQQITIDGKAPVLGRVQVNYLEIPRGEHSLRLTSTANLMIRILQDEESYYLFPEYNRPELRANIPQITELPQWVNRASWQLTEQELSAIVSDKPKTLAELEKIALRLARDNSRREGGLLGTMIIREAFKRYPYQPKIRRLANSLLGKHSFYRNLLPWKIEPLASSMAFHRFITYQLRPPQLPNLPLLVAEQHLDAYLKRIPGAYFAPLSPKPCCIQQQIYKLPKRTVPSLLRVVVKEPNQLQQSRLLWVQFDDSPPVMMQVIPQHLELDANYYRFNQGKAGLKILALNHNTGMDTLDGPFASRQKPASLISASYFVLPLPSKVRQIKVWRQAGDSEIMHVAIQYRAASTFRLNESEYFSISSQFWTEDKFFQYFVKALGNYQNQTCQCRSFCQNKPGEHINHHPDMYNYWLPLIRFLHARAKHFRTAIATPKHQQKIKLLKRAEIDELLPQARQAIAEQRWLVALELWSRLARGSRGQLQRDAKFARIEALENLGEMFLAKRFLHGLYLTDSSLSQEAFEKLFRRYESDNNSLAKIPLLATETLRNPTPAMLIRLSYVLVENGYYDFAFMIGMALPKGLRPHALMLELTYRFGWWESFEQLLWQAPEKTRKLWQGYRAQNQGDYAMAMDFWRDAGAAGKQLSSALEQGLQIRQQLQMPASDLKDKFEQREAAIRDWDRWQTAHPGPKHWETAASLVKDYTRSEFVYGIEQNLFFQVFISKVEHPVKLRIPGPLRVRLLFRTLHERNDNEPIDAWVQVKDLTNKSAPKLHVVRLSNILPSDGLSLVGQEQRLGSKTIAEFEFGPGLHEIEVSAIDLPIAVRVQAEKPRLPLAVLPPINEESLVAALTDFVTVPGFQSFETKFRNRQLTPTTCECLNCILLIPQCIPINDERNNQSLIKKDLPIIQKHLSRWQLRAYLEPPRNTLAYREAQVAKYLAAKNYQAALAVPFTNSDILKRMTLLLWIAELQPSQAEQLIVDGESIFKRHPKVASLRPLWSALRINQSWNTLYSIENSAGLHFVDMPGWQPENPNLRIRKSLLKEAVVAMDEQVISGYNPMGFSILNLTATSFRLILRMDDIAYLRPVPLSVLYWLNDEPHRRIELTDKQPIQTVELEVPEGEHTIYVAIEKPVVYQFLRIRIKEIGRDEAVLFQENERSYHIATHEEPVIISVLGPTWLRIDEWHPTHIDSRFQKVAKGWQTLTFPPAKWQEKALLRLHQRLPLETESKQKVELRYFKVVRKAQPEPLVRVYEENSKSVRRRNPVRESGDDGNIFRKNYNKTEPIFFPEVIDNIVLTGLRDDTRSFTAALLRRQNVEEDDLVLQDFLELSTTYRSFDEVARNYLRSKWLTRLNEYGDITLGTRRDIHYKQAQGREFAFRLSGSVYAQKIWGDGLEWHGLLKGALSQYWRLNSNTYHVPRIEAFARWLSLSDEPEGLARRLDNDVFSDYKADHRFGVAIADSLTYEPWRDTRWVGRVRLNSNENLFRPDYLRLQAEWQQLLGDMQFNVGYRFYHYWSDDDRRESVNRNRLSLNFSSNIWHDDLSRWEWGIKLDQDLDRNSLQGMFYLSWHDSRGRGYRDFLPGEVDFLRLRKEQLPSINNTMIPFGENLSVISDR